jgi:hypothetical protein
LAVGEAVAVALLTLKMALTATLVACVAVPLAVVDPVETLKPLNQLMV